MSSSFLKKDQNFRFAQNVKFRAFLIFNKVCMADLQNISYLSVYYFCNPWNATLFIKRDFMLYEVRWLSYTVLILPRFARGVRFCTKSRSRGLLPSLVACDICHTSSRRKARAPPAVEPVGRRSIGIYEGKGWYSRPRSCSALPRTASQFDFAKRIAVLLRSGWHGLAFALRENMSLIKSVFVRKIDKV